MPKDYTVGFFDEKKGHKSSMRLYSFMSLIAAIVFAFFIVATEQVTANTVAIFFIFVLGAFAPKTVSKFAELKVGKSDV